MFLCLSNEIVILILINIIYEKERMNEDIDNNKCDPLFINI